MAGLLACLCGAPYEEVASAPSDGPGLLDLPEGVLREVLGRLSGRDGAALSLTCKHLRWDSFVARAPEELNLASHNSFFYKARFVHLALTRGLQHTAVHGRLRVEVLAAIPTLTSLALQRRHGQRIAALGALTGLQRLALRCDRHAPHNGWGRRHRYLQQAEHARLPALTELTLDGPVHFYEGTLPALKHLALEGAPPLSTVAEHSWAQVHSHLGWWSRGLAFNWGAACVEYYNGWRVQVTRLTLRGMPLKAGCFQHEGAKWAHHCLEAAGMYSVRALAFDGYVGAKLPDMRLSGGRNMTSLEFRVWGPVCFTAGPTCVTLAEWPKLVSLRLSTPLASRELDKTFHVTWALGALPSLEELALTGPTAVIALCVAARPERVLPRVRSVTLSKAYLALGADRARLCAVLMGLPRLAALLIDDMLRTDAFLLARFKRQGHRPVCVTARGRPRQVVWRSPQGGPCELLAPW